MNATIKTHKPPGEVSARLLHNCGGNQLGGVANVVASEMHGYVSKISFLVFSTRDVIDTLSNVVIESGDKIGTIDIKDFFMVRPHHEHIRSVQQINELKHFDEATGCLLQHQYVKRAGGQFDNYYQVVSGSGMGSQLSSALCDSTLF